MPELTVGIMPAAISVQPENRLIPGDFNCFKFVSHIEMLAA